MTHAARANQNDIKSRPSVADAAAGCAHASNTANTGRGLMELALLSALVACVAMSGCRTSPQMIDLRNAAAIAELAPPFETRVVIGESVEGRPIEAAMLGTGDDVILILATIHGNEQAGTPLTQQLIRHLRDKPGLLHGKRVVVIPVANPDGRAANERRNANQVDLNRNFPARNRVNSQTYGLEALSEPEARALYRIIDTQRPDRVVSIHQPLACLDYDGPGAQLAQQMSDATGLPVRQLGAQPGSLGSYVGHTLGRPIITLEMPRDADDLNRHELWDRYGPALVEAIRYPKSDRPER